MDRVRVGVVGTAGIFLGVGDFGHLPAYTQVDEAKIVALCDIDKNNLERAERMVKRVFEERAEIAEEEGDIERAKRLRDDSGDIRCYTDIEEMLNKEGPDLVDVCSPPFSHVSVVTRALKGGANVMCEKPMARTWLECLKIVEAVSESGKLYQHNEQQIYDTFWYNARKLIDSGEIGDLVAMFLPTSVDEPGTGREAPWYWDPKRNGGGALLDMAVHPITVSWFLAGFNRKPTKVKAAEPYGIALRMRKRLVMGRFENVEVEDDAHLLVEYEDPDTGAWATAHIEGSWGFADSWGPIIIGTDGSFQPLVEEGKLFIKITDPSGNERKLLPRREMGGKFGFPGEIRNMCRCVIDGAKPLCDENIGAETLAIADSAYFSQLNGKRGVHIDEFKEYALEIQRREGDNASDVLIGSLLSGIGK
ncbi:MAG: Gfo/Idh/MocA family protein [bacterium]